MSGPLEKGRLVCPDNPRSLVRTSEPRADARAGRAWQCRGGIDLVLNSRVSAIERGRLTITDAAGQEQGIAFGACCWATGVAMHPLVKHLQEQLPSQNHFR